MQKKSFYMKYFIAIYFILFAGKALCQVPSQGRSATTADSFLIAVEKKNSVFLNKPFPHFSVTTNGIESSDKRLKGKVVFINFWFAACAPCIAEMNELNRLFKHFSKYKNFEFVSFTFDKLQTIDSVKKKYNIHYNIFPISQDECYRLNNNNGFPTSIILSSKGLVTFIHATDEVNSAAIKKYFTGKVYPLLLRELNKDQ